MRADRIDGQEKAFEYIDAAVSEERLAHSVIFAGPKGVGRSNLALYLAKAVNCLSGGKRPCGSCRSCDKIERGIHPDVKTVTRDEKSGEIKIGEIRKIGREIVLKPYEGRYKVFIIEEADYMNQEASNAFLKTLEEPPQKSLIILTAESALKLLSTVASRCQIVRLHALDKIRLKHVLMSRYGMDDRRAEFASRFSQGRLGRALCVTDKAVEARNETLEAFFEKKAKEQLIKKRTDLIEKLDILALWYRDLLVYKASGDTELLVNIDLVDHIKRATDSLDADNILRVFERVTETRRLVEDNVNPKLALRVLYRDMPEEGTFSFQGV